MKRRNRKANARQGNGYDRLENRQLLATLFFGTNQVDVASIEYAGENRVDIRINDILHEDVDSSDGISINLGRQGFVDNGVFIAGETPIDDRISIDHRITDSIEIYNAEEITIDGGDNEFHIFTRENLSLIHI